MKALGVFRPIGRFLRARWPELLVFWFGVVLRLSMVWNYHFRWNFDSDSHWQLIEWMRVYGAASNTESMFQAYHPPLFYGLSAWLVAHGWTRPMLMAIPVSTGILRFGILWLGLELHLKRFRRARVIALLLAAILPASIHMDGMIFGEGLSCLLHAIILILLPYAFRRESPYRWTFCLWIGLLLGIAFLTKISALVMLIAIGATVALEFFLIERSWPERIRRALPWLGTVLVSAGICSWYFAQNVRQYEKPFVTSFELPLDGWRVAQHLQRPELDRRTLGYVFGWSNDIYYSPYHPAAAAGQYRFFPTLLATAVVDYWDFGFAGYAATVPGQPPDRDHSWHYPEASRASIWGGTVLMIAALVAYGVALVGTWRSRNISNLALLSVPFFMILAAVHFGVAFPENHGGVIKATYVMFGAPPLFALVGLAFEWTTRRATRYGLALILSLALVGVGYYTVVSRLSKHFPWEAMAAKGQT